MTGKKVGFVCSICKCFARVVGIWYLNSWGLFLIIWMDQDLNLEFQPLRDEEVETASKIPRHKKPKGWKSLQNSLPYSKSEVYKSMCQEMLWHGGDHINLEAELSVHLQVMESPMSKAHFSQYLWAAFRGLLLC